MLLITCRLTINISLCATTGHKRKVKLTQTHTTVVGVLYMMTYDVISRVKKLTDTHTLHIPMWVITYITVMIELFHCSRFQF